MDENRRILLGASAALAAAALASELAWAETPVFDPIPDLPKTPKPGRPGDFGFLTGEWRIKNHSLVQGAWLAYEGEATVHSLLDGLSSVEELRIPARKFSGMGLRLLDVTTQVWSDFWVNARSGALTMPGQTGSFENGAGVFSSTFEENGRPMTSIGVWDQITPTSCRWRQAASGDGGATWAQNWIMVWRRA